MSDKPLNSFGWVGGKSQLRKVIANYIPTDIQHYIEPFGGAGWVLFFKDRWARYEIYNDLNNELYNLFNIIKYHADALISEMEFMEPSRKRFDLLLHEYKPITDIQKAAKFLYILYHSFSSQQKSFATSLRHTTKSFINVKEKIQGISARLDKVTIENLDYTEIIPKYDDASSFFYLDPPYFDYSKGFNHIYKPIEHEKLAELLKTIKGRFLLSYNDKEEIRELYKDFHILGVSRNQCFNLAKEYKELLIANYPLEAK